MTELNSGMQELTIDELNLVSGGDDGDGNGSGTGGGDGLGKLRRIERAIVGAIVSVIKAVT